MNAKTMLTALAVAGASGATMAIDATQFDVPPSTKSRAEVRAELEQAKLDGTLMSGGDATVFVDRPVAALQRTRAEVRAELEQARLDGTLMSGGEATVFVDRMVPALPRTSEEVRDEARTVGRAR
jgi:pyruvate-formate lyase-activating enzyme